MFEKSTLSGPRPAPRILVASLTLTVVSLTTGCANTALPCMQYQPQMVTRTVTMRGYGAVQVTEEAMVCTHRAGSMEDGLLGP